MKTNDKSANHKDKTIDTVVKKNICCGCGSCTVVCPNSCIEIVYGKRFNYPVINFEACSHCGLCLKVCPSRFIIHEEQPEYGRLSKKENCNCCLIHAADQNIRMNASSGGFITGLIAHLIESGKVDGGVVAKSQGHKPWIAQSVIAADKQELLDACASKYAPVSNGTALNEVIKKPGTYVFVGAPCMIEGLRKLQNIIPALKERIVLTIGFVCAGMASRQSTLAFLQRYKVDLDQVYKICYRGDGWPGYFTVLDKEKNVLLKKPLLGGSLDLVVPQDHYLRCDNCLDRWAHYADIVVSDPWCDRMLDHETQGWSGILIRTKPGQDAVDSAVAHGDLIAENVSAEQMYNYNDHLFITTEHQVHSAIALYQLLFLGRFKGLGVVLKNLVNRKGMRLLTTLKARFDRNYYENENVRKKILKVNPGATEHLRVRSEAAHQKYAGAVCDVNLSSNSTKSV